MMGSDGMQDISKIHQVGIAELSLSAAWSQLYWKSRAATVPFDDGWDSVVRV
ncbi:MAG: hypothetical protein MPJ50_13785 [Pirellulales bacterium]|nr:hypothetical protein [Pirellulales bacterium]